MLTDIKQFSDKFLKQTTNEKIQIIPVEGLKIARKLLMGFLPDRQLSIAAKSFVLLLEDPKNIFS